MANFKGYIASIGSAGALVAASLLILSVVGALVAFDGWPEPTSGGRAESVVGGGGAEHVTGTAEQDALERAGASGKAAAASAKADASDAVAAGVRLTRRGSGAGKPRRGPSGSGGRTGGRTAPVAVPPSGTSTPVAPSNGGGVAPAGGGPVSVPEESGVSGDDHERKTGKSGGKSHGKSGGKSHGRKDSKGN
jgi:hypothetical protein